MDCKACEAPKALCCQVLEEFMPPSLPVGSGGDVSRLEMQDNSLCVMRNAQHEPANRK